MLTQYCRTQNWVLSGIVTLTGSLTSVALFAIDPEALPLNVTCVNVPAGYSIDAVTVAVLPVPVSTQVPTGMYQFASTSRSEVIAARETCPVRLISCRFVLLISSQRPQRVATRPV